MLYVMQFLLNLKWIGPLALGALLLLAGSASLLTASRRADWQQTTGTIKTIDSHPCNRTGKTGGGCLGSIRYAVNGEYYTIDKDVVLSGSKVGDSTNVFYDPNDPNEARTFNTNPRYKIQDGIIMTIAGLAISAVGVFRYLRSRS